MRFSLRTLIITAALVPPLVAMAWWYPFVALFVLLVLGSLLALILQQPKIGINQGQENGSFSVTATSDRWT